MYDWINGKLAQNQKKPGRGEVVAGGVDSMGGVVLRVIDAQIDPASNKMGRSWAEEVRLEICMHIVPLQLTHRLFDTLEMEIQKNRSLQTPRHRTA